MSVSDRPEGALLRAAEDARFADIATLSPPGGLLIISPHPDDETLGCGQALAAAVDAGRQVGIVLLTDGEGSHPASHAFPRDRLIDLRAGELRHALTHLAGDRQVPIHRLGLRDGASGVADVTPDAMREILAFSRSLGTRTVWSTWGRDPHCDHECAALLAARVASELSVPHWGFAVWGRFGDGPVPGAIVRFDDPALAPAKRRAMNAYASQLTGLIDDDPGAFVMPETLCEHFASHPEVFVREG